MVGSYRTGNQSKYLYYLILSIFIVGVSCVGFGAASGDVRLIVYGGLNPDSEKIPSVDNITLPTNVTLILSSPDLGFIVVDVPSANETWYTNEIKKLPFVVGIEHDTIRKTESTVIDNLTNKKEDDFYLANNQINDIIINQEAFFLSNIQSAQKMLKPKRNVTVGLVDTGIAKKTTSVNIIAGYDFVNQDSYSEDTSGHGTHLAGIITSIVNNSSSLQIIPEKAGKSDEIFASLSALGIYHAAQTGANIILCGYGGSVASTAEERACQYASEKGILIIAPAGNDDSNMAHYPSDYYQVMSIGSIGKNQGLSYFSNYGIYTELVAPGEAVLSTGLNNTFIGLTGTSQSAAIVTGIASLLYSSTDNVNASDIRQILNDGAKDLGRNGRDIYYGWGAVDAEKSADISAHQKPNRIQEVETVRKLSINGTSNNFSLNPGWNFISFPAEFSSDKKLSEVFSGIKTAGHSFWIYKPEYNDWISLKADSDVSPGLGILIYSEKEESIPVVYKTGHTNLSLNKGWNLVGSLTDNTSKISEITDKLPSSWISILKYNSTLQGYDPAIIRGADGIIGNNPVIKTNEAFWIYLTSNETIMLSGPQ